jgi:hypothetical protein
VNELGKTKNILKETQTGGENIWTISEEENV